MILIKSKNGPDNAQSSFIDLLLRHKSVLHSFHQTVSKLLCPHHFHVLSAVRRFYRVAYAPTEIRHYKAVEIPLFFQYLVQKIVMVSAVHSVISVVRTHDTGSTGVNTVLEMRKIDLLLCTLVAGHTAFETRIFHIIKCVMLYTRHNVLILNAPHQCRAHLTDLVSLFPVCLLASSPTGIIREIDTHASKKISAEGPCLFPDTVSDLLLKFRGKRSPPRHRYRETGCLVISADNAARTVYKQHRGNFRIFKTSGCIWNHIVMILIALHCLSHLCHCIRSHVLHINISAHQPYFLLQSQLVYDFLCLFCKRKPIFFCRPHFFISFLFFFGVCS